MSWWKSACANHSTLVSRRAGERALAVWVRVCLDAPSWGEWCEVEVLVELELVVKYLADRHHYVNFVLVEQGLQVDRAEVGTALLEAVGLQEVLVEGLADRLGVVSWRLRVGVDRNGILAIRWTSCRHLCQFGWRWRREGVLIPLHDC